MEHKNGKNDLNVGVAPKNGNKRPEKKQPQVSGKSPEESSHEKHVKAGHKGAEACCKKMGPESVCCGKK